MLSKNFVASTRVTYLHHWPTGDVLSRAPCSLQIRLSTLEPCSRDWRADTDRTHAKLYLSCGKDSVSNQHRHSSMHVDDVAVATAHACTICMCAYKMFSVEAWKRLRSDLQNAISRVSQNRDFCQFGLIPLVQTYNLDQTFLITFFQKTTQKCCTCKKMGQVQNGRLNIRYRSSSKKNKVNKCKILQCTHTFLCYSIAQSTL